MALGELAGDLIIQLVILDAGLWLLYVRTRPMGPVRKARRRKGLGVLLLILLIAVGLFVIGPLNLAVINMQIAVLPAIFVLVAVQIVAFLTLWAAIIRPNG